jgi:hypothetical protein
MHHLLTDGQLVSFYGPYTDHDQFNQIGVAWEGGVHVQGGPFDQEPFPFTFRLAIVIDNQGGSAKDMEEARRNSIEIGDTFVVEGLAGMWKVEEPSWTNAGIKFSRISDPGLPPSAPRLASLEEPEN